MSFKSWSSAQTAAAEAKTADKPKAAPASSRPARQPDKASAKVLPTAKVPSSQPEDRTAKASATKKPNTLIAGGLAGAVRFFRKCLTGGRPPARICGG